MILDLTMTKYLSKNVAMHKIVDIAEKKEKGKKEKKIKERMKDD